MTCLSVMMMYVAWAGVIMDGQVMRFRKLSRLKRQK